MRLHSTIALAAMAAALTTPQAVMAATGDPSTQQQLQAALQQLAEMQAQINALKSQVDQQAATPSVRAEDRAMLPSCATFLPPALSRRDEGHGVIRTRWKS